MEEGQEQLGMGLVHNVPLNMTPKKMKIVDCF